MASSSTLEGESRYVVGEGDMPGTSAISYVAEGFVS